ncbi:tripartite tricarboxylate transporter substrate binding protein [Parapusillimonas granuli]|uniref:Bug family tripartite tricarboxylate transporter substrate binding protein n=1 Tax=Parapusillimonas granuli TaxID=380911 RepID=UPI0017E6EC57|nr:tripartite-type tricarboxylate transporter receptor subunit TctC [Parapusillimonas granuli]MEB2399361.1 tripartite tricarboxylate transporter substrate binding protein [Alcaligenaceae bacterium]
MKQNRLATIIGAISIALAAVPHAAASSADSYPERSISWIVPFPPGGAMDAIARVLSETMSKDLGQSIVVENKPGAGGNIGASYVTKARPDGYTIMIAANGMAVNPFLYKNLSYDPIKDFEPISLLAAVPNILVTQATRSDVNSLADVIRQAKEKPGHYTYASAGVGTSIHLAGALFTYTGQLDMLHIPYKGSGPAVSDLMGGQVDYMFDSITSAKPYIESGKLKALAITTKKRSSTLPDLPTVDESGMPGYELTPWFATFAPAGTPAPIIEKLNAAMLKAMETDRVKQIFATIGAEKIGSTPRELASYMAQETAKWKKIIAETGISVD